MLWADSICQYFGPKSEPTKYMVWIINVHRSNVIPEKEFSKQILKKNQQTTKMLKILPSMHRGKDRFSHEKIETKIIMGLVIRKPDFVTSNQQTCDQSVHMRSLISTFIVPCM